MPLKQEVVIEFAGMPKSGKTTTLDIVAHYLRRNSLPVSEFHGGGRYAPIDKRNIGDLNIYLACDAVKYLLSIGQGSCSPRIHLMDRGVVDRTIFTVALNSLGRLSDQQRDSLMQLMSLPEISRKLDVAFAFVTSPQKSLEREAFNKLILRDGRVMNTPLLSALRSATADYISSPHITDVPLISIDTDRLDQDIRGTSLQVLESIAGVLRDAGVDLPVPSERG